MRNAIEYVTVSPGRAGCERTRLTNFTIEVLGANGPAIVAPGCATANSRPLSVTNPFAVLTVREREMANLVAAGLNNRDIADRLTVSVRTVEGHLYRACTKCDCTDRDQLAALIRSGQPR